MKIIIKNITQKSYSFKFINTYDRRT